MHLFLYIVNIMHILCIASASAQQGSTAFSGTAVCSAAGHFGV